MLARPKGVEPGVMKMHRIAVLAFGTVALLSACGGEVPQPTQVIRPTDSDMICMDLLRETGENDTAILRLADRDDQIHRRNVHYTVVDGVMFPPAMLTLDFRDQPQQEISALRARNKRLIELADMKGC
jgi:hypothetical protein